MAAAVHVGRPGDRVRRGDHAGDDARGAAPSAATAASAARGLVVRDRLALQDRARAEVQRRAGLRADDPVGGEAVGALPTLEGVLRSGAEDAVGGDPERLLEGADTATRAARGGLRRHDRGLGGMGTRMRARGVAAQDLALQDGPRAEIEGRARLRAGDAVGRQAVRALPVLEGLLGGRAEVAVDGDAQRPLELGDAARALGRDRGSGPDNRRLRRRAGVRGRSVLVDRRGPPALGRRGGQARVVAARLRRGCGRGLAPASADARRDRGRGAAGDREQRRDRRAPRGEREGRVGGVVTGAGADAREIPELGVREIAHQRAAARGRRRPGEAPTAAAAAGEGALERVLPDIGA
jgi:hypothetical protein